MSGERHASRDSMSESLSVPQAMRLAVGERAAVGKPLGTFLCTRTRRVAEKLLSGLHGGTEIAGRREMSRGKVPCAAGPGPPRESRTCRVRGVPVVRVPCTRMSMWALGRRRGGGCPPPAETAWQTHNLGEGARGDAAPGRMKRVTPWAVVGQSSPR